MRISIGCICLFSYIKPQQPLSVAAASVAVYVSSPTSNHNLAPAHIHTGELYMSLLLHQTTTYCKVSENEEMLYMSLLLHQTTTLLSESNHLISCICLFSYIKPQPALCSPASSAAVYVSSPTSNHNSVVVAFSKMVAVYVSSPTSNHNFLSVVPRPEYAVYVSSPTSNHNRRRVLLLFHIAVYVSSPTSNHN